jgi:CRP/FNR family transcriptional regulator, cyclic AMP receptor protein
MNLLWDNIFRLNKDQADLATALRENALFQDLNRRELALVQSIVHLRRYHAGEPIFRQGEVGVGMYIIVKGRVEILLTNYLPDANTQLDVFVTQLGDGDFFGELSLVEDNGRRTASAIAQEESTVIGFFKPDLIEIINRSPASGVKIISRLAEILGRRLKETTDKVTELRKAVKELREPPPLMEKT